MDKFLGKCRLPKFTQETIDCLNRSVYVREVEIVVKNLPSKKTPGPDDSPGEFYQTFQENKQYN